MLLIQFLEVIWSMPKTFVFFQKPLDKFFYKFDNSEINRQEIFSDLGIVEFIKKFIERFLEKYESFRHGPNYL